MLASSAGLLRCSSSLKRSKPFCTSTTRSTASRGSASVMMTSSVERAALQCDCALKVQACLADNLDAIAGNFTLHRSTTSAQLLRPQRLFTQSPGPIWCECALYRTASGVLINADGRVKESADVVRVGPAGSGNNRSADPAVEVGKSRNVGGERSHLLGLVDHDEVVTRSHDLRRPNAEGPQQFARHLTLLRRPCGKVQCKAVLFASHGQHAAARVEANRPRTVLPKREHIGRCQGCVSAEIDFYFRRKPAQVETAITARNDKGSSAVSVLTCNPLHAAVREKRRKHAHTGRIACKQLARECIHVIVRNWHLRAPFRPRLEAGPRSGHPGARGRCSAVAGFSVTATPGLQRRRGAPSGSRTRRNWRRSETA